MSHPHKLLQIVRSAQLLLTQFNTVVQNAQGVTIHPSCPGLVQPTLAMVINQRDQRDLVRKDANEQRKFLELSVTGKPWIVVTRKSS